MGSIGEYSNGLFFANEKEAKIWKHIPVGENSCLTCSEKSFSDSSFSNSINLSQDFKIKPVRRRLVFDQEPDETDLEVENILAHQIRKTEVSNHVFKKVPLEKNRIFSGQNI